MLFHYKATNQAGETVTGEREAPDRFALAREMANQGLTLINAESQQKVAKVAWLNRWLSLLGGIKMKDKIIFAGSLSSMLAAGLSLSRALAVLERQLANKKFKAVMSAIADRTSRGESLSQALAAFPDIFPPVFSAMVMAGEESGKLAEALELVRDQLNKSYELRRKVQGAMIYPAVIVSVIIIIGILMMIFLVPNLTALFRDLNVELPLTTRLVIWVSDFLVAHTLAFVGGVLVALGLIIRLIKTDWGHRWLAATWLRLPVIATIIKNLNAAVTMRTLSSLVSSGVSLVEALTITGRVLQNPFYQTVVNAAVAQVEKGANLSSIFRAEERLYPVLVGEMTEVGEETGDLPGMLQKGAIFFEDEVEQTTKNLSTLIEPALMVLIGIAVGFFAVSMLGPMYSLSDKI